MAEAARIQEVFHSNDRQKCENKESRPLRIVNIYQEEYDLMEDVLLIRAGRKMRARMLQREEESE